MYGLYWNVNILWRAWRFWWCFSFLWCRSPPATLVNRCILSAGNQSYDSFCRILSYSEDLFLEWINLSRMKLVEIDPQLLVILWCSQIYELWIYCYTDYSLVFYFLGTDTQRKDSTVIRHSRHLNIYQCKDSFFSSNLPFEAQFIFNIISIVSKYILQWNATWREKNGCPWIPHFCTEEQ